MTPDECLTVWRELVDVTRLIAAVQAVTQTERGVWRAGLVALEERRQVLAYALSLEKEALLESVYVRLVEELRSTGPSANPSTGMRVH